MTRLRWALAATVLAAVLLFSMVLDAARRRARARTGADRSVVAVTGLPDLALSSSVRWLRHPSQAEPGAPFSDGPATLDVDPAGALIGPPREIVAVGGMPIERRR